MTNYNERLDEILQNHFRGYAARSFPECQDNASEIWNNSVEKAKQAITSLIKGLVAEAKPGTWVDPEDTDDLKWQGYVDGVIDFEQNLLKALEDKK